MKEGKSDYLKYWRVIRQYIKVKYGIGEVDLELLLFLYSEDYFTQDKFQEFNSLLSWDKKRFEKLRENGWIESSKTFRVGRRIKYSLSFKTKRMIDSIYSMLEGKEIATSEGTNPMFARNVGYKDKVYRNFIMRLKSQSKRKFHGPPKDGYKYYPPKKSKEPPPHPSPE
jgi:hypothetical protein